jgi:GTP cyclohydrolase I
MTPRRSSKRAPKRPSKSKPKSFDRPTVERAIRLLLDGIGEDRSRPGLIDTPRRVCDLYEEILSGMWQDPADQLSSIRAEHDHDLVIVKDIRFASVCEHHLLPFLGKVGVAFVPRGKRIVGVSKIVRAVDIISQRLQIQERMTAQLADVIQKELKPSGVLVKVEAEHLCMTIRGVKKPGSLIVTTEARGVLRQPGKQALVLSSFSS